MITKNKKAYQLLQIEFRQLLIDVLSLSGVGNKDFDVEQDAIPFV